jgi:hypothetical protein
MDQVKDRTYDKEMARMKVRYIGKTRHMELTEGKVYEVVSVERTWYRIQTDMLGDYLYPPHLFEIISE